MVWDIWTNIPSTDPLAKVYDRMVRSFRFGKNSPANLREAYGREFKSLDMEAMTKANSGTQDQNDYDGQQTLGPILNDLTSSWQSPVLKKTTGELRTVKCGSPAHTGSSYWAADISVTDHTSVWNSKIGTVTFAGNKNDGYGNLVQVQAQGGKEAYYGHLESISSATLSNINKQIGTGFWLGWSGHSTCSTCQSLLPHLHFHVHWGGTAMDLWGMTGFYPDNDNTPWPGSPGSGIETSCAQMGR